MPYQRTSSQPENPFTSLIPDQTIAIVPEFTLESGYTLYNVPVAYTTRGKLNANGDNAMVICHALSGSADVSDWWGPLMGGPGRAFDVSRFFIICMNSLGSPYGTASPMTSRDGEPALGSYGPEFPLTTVRDDVRLFKLLLDDLGVKRIAACVGGSMGGMLVLEFAYFGKDYVRCIVPIATSARNSAWCISWGEAQRQCIYSDPKYEDGYYPFEDPPSAGLGAARMSALLTYRSRDSFESRFGRNIPDPSRQQSINAEQQKQLINEHFNIHNDGHRRVGLPRASSRNGSLSHSPISSAPSSPRPDGLLQRDGATNGHGSVTNITVTDPQFHGATPLPAAIKTGADRRRPNTHFSAQSYLRYQGEKFIKRFDANCYIAITRKLDTHDVSLHCTDPDSKNPLQDALTLIEQPTLVLGIESDGLFTFSEQQQLAAHIPNARLEKIESPEGHDAFLLQFEQVNRYVLDFLTETLPDIMGQPGSAAGEVQGVQEVVLDKVTKNSTFGEAEVEDITAW